MSKDVKVEIIVDGLNKLAKDISDIAAYLQSLAEDTKPDEQENGLTYEAVRAVLAEKSRAGFRADVKAILTSHGVKQLSDVSDPAMLAQILKEAENIG